MTTKTGPTLQVGGTSALAGLLLATGGVAAMADDRFAEFLAANPPLEDTVCAYTTTATSSEYPGETRVERFSPGTGWELRTVNGAPPTPRALKDYRDDDSDRKRRQQPADLDFTTIVRPDTARVVEENATRLVFAFTPDSADGGRGRAMMEKTSGRLTVAKDDLRPLRYVAELTAPTSPMPGMKVEAYRQEMTFVVEPATGASLVATMEFAMRGKAFVVRRMDSEARIEASDYDCGRNRPRSSP